MSQLNIKPLADRVVIEPAPAETKTASGIIIPDSAKEKPQEGIVVAACCSRRCYSGPAGQLQLSTRWFLQQHPRRH